MRDRRGAGHGQPRHHRQNRRERHGGNEAQQQIAAHGFGQVHHRHVAAADQLARQIAALVEGRVLPDDHNGRQAQHRHDQVEKADEARGDEHRFARLLGIRHGKEAHEDVRQSCRAKHQSKRQRDQRQRVGHEFARQQNPLAIAVRGHSFLEQQIEGKAEFAQRQKRQQRPAHQQQPGLDDLHPRGGDHAAEGDVDRHQQTHGNHRIVVWQTEQQLNQLPCPDHLHHQIKTHHRQRAEGRHRADTVLIEAKRSDVRDGYAPQIADALGEQKQQQRPGDKEADRVQHAIEAVEEDHAGNAQQRRRGHVVTGQCQTVLEAADTTAGRVEIVHGFGFGGGPVRDAKRRHDEDQEHADSGDVDRLFFDALDNVAGHGASSEYAQQHGQDEVHKDAFHTMAPARISAVRSSNSPLARWM
ncbi:hypothetical protein D3C86_1145120 [compost metagenome]